MSGGGGRRRQPQTQAEHCAALTALRMLPLGCGHPGDATTAGMGARRGQKLGSPRKAGLCSAVRGLIAN